MVAACGLAVGLVGCLVVGVAVSVGACGGGAGWFVAVGVGGVLGGSAGAGACGALLWLLTGVVVVGCPLVFRAGFFLCDFARKKKSRKILTAKPIGKPRKKFRCYRNFR